MTDEYIETGSIFKCRHCHTKVEVIDINGMMVEFKPINTDNSNEILQEVFACFLIDFEKIENK